MPIVGDFAGPKALRARRHVSEANVTRWSRRSICRTSSSISSREGRWPAFCGNVATLPLDRTSTFIRSIRNGMYGRGVGLDSQLGNMATEVKTCVSQ